MPRFVREFRDFAVRGNVVDMAVGIIVGAAFGTIAKSLVDDIVMPVVGLLTSGVEFKDLFILLKAGAEPGPYPTLADAQAAGAVTVNYGQFVNNIVTFLIVAFAVFLLVRTVNRLRHENEAPPPAPPATRECPYCFSNIPAKATRCPNCTSSLG